MVSDQKPFVTVVIPHRGSDKSLEKCLSGLRNQNYPPNLREVIIVLNEAESRPLDFPLSSGERLLWEPRFYSYSARNKGVLEALGEVLAFTDSDCVPESNWIDEGVRILKQGADLVAGHVELTFSSSPLTPAACYEKLFAFDQAKNASLGRAATANLFTTKSMFSKTELFSKTAVSGEDFRWTSNASKRGAVMKYAPMARVNHPARESLGLLIAKARRVVVNFSPGRGGRETISQMACRYWAAYLLPPSTEKIRLCGPRELLLAYLTGVIVQVVKMFFAVHRLSVSRIVGARR